MKKQSHLQREAIICEGQQMDLLFLEFILTSQPV